VSGCRTDGAPERHAIDPGASPFGDSRNPWDGGDAPGHAHRAVVRDGGHHAIRRLLARSPQAVQVTGQGREPQRPIDARAGLAGARRGRGAPRPHAASVTGIILAVLRRQGCSAQKRK